VVVPVLYSYLVRPKKAKAAHDEALMVGANAAGPLVMPADRT
jgi:hypothetical protein